ncbi:MAG TPA: hypothetical protein VGL75_09390 [Acidothermaceae bacterium]|jgi:hypothetical protein
MTLTLAAAVKTLQDNDAATERSLQTAIGWSSLADCEAAIGYQLEDAWASDDSDRWPMIRGTALHEFLLPILAKLSDELVGIEVPTVYGGIPGHADLVETHRVIDLKTTKMANLTAWQRDETAMAWHQVNGYCAGLIDAGLVHEPATVAILAVPVDGKFPDWQLFERPFDRAVADGALMRLADIQARKTAGEQLRRERPYAWCQAVCDFFTLCRDGAPAENEVITDAELVAAIDAYGTAGEIKSAADKEQRTLAPLIRGLRGTAKGWRISMTNPSGTKSVLDEDQVRADYAANQLSVPTVDVPSSSPSLRVTRLKETT